jgi:hypothetical protein
MILSIALNGKNKTTSNSRAANTMMALSQINGIIPAAVITNARRGRMCHTGELYFIDNAVNPVTG